ncbi:MAG: O-antigen ligase family protein [Firmicutes bacterium]|nr:O-antigen ligase family protein [Bacillota bacterium]
MGDSAQAGRLRWPIYLLAGFPVVDYFLRIYPWGIVGKTWYELILIATALFAMRSYMLNGRKEMYPTQKMVLFMAVLGFVYILMDIGYVEVALAGYKIDFIFMLFAVLLPYVVAKEDIVPILKLMVMTGFLLGIHGVYEYITKAPVPSTWNVIGENVRSRVYSLFGSPNILGAYVAFLLPTTIGMGLYQKAKGERLFYFVAAGFMTLTLLFTFTRGAWIAGFVGVFVLALLWDKRLAVAAAVFAVLAALFVHPVQTRIDEFFSPVYWHQTLQNGRIAEWLRAYDQMVNNPLFGAGIGRYGGAVASKFFGIIYVDGYYAHMLAELGLVGFTAFMYLLFVYLRDVWRVWKRTTDPQMKILIAGVFGSLIAVVTHNLVENVFEEPAMNMLFWLSGTLILIYGAKDGEDHA